MCNENSSSAILAENTKLNINHVQQRDMEWSDNAFKNLDDLLSQNPRVLNIRGGEPLYNKQLLKIVEDMPVDRARSMILHITTNATVWNQRWQDALKKFKLIRFMFSIDASDKLYEYIRFPGHWNLVDSNVQQIMSLSNVKALVNCVVQNLNISYLEGLIRWCQDHNLWLILDILQKPGHLHYTNLTDSQKDIALANLENVLKIHPGENVLDTIKNCMKELEKSKFDQDNWNQFVDKISQRDQLRGNDYRRFIT
jgi:molybdenum cofactor biosynthesis enzyme MoaA